MILFHSRIEGARIQHVLVPFLAGHQAALVPRLPQDALGRRNVLAGLFGISQFPLDNLMTKAICHDDTMHGTLLSVRSERTAIEGCRDRPAAALRELIIHVAPRLHKRQPERRARSARPIRPPQARSAPLLPRSPDFPR